MKKLRKILSVLTLIILVGSDFLTSISYALEDVLEDSVVVQTENEGETENVENEEENVEEENSEVVYEDESIEEFEPENSTGNIVEEGTGEVFEISSGEVKELTEETVEGITGDVEELTGEVVESTEIGEEIVIEDMTYNEEPITGEKTYNDVTVRVEALPGIFPEGTELKIEPIKWGDLSSLKDKLVEEKEEIKEGTTIVAFDITFKYEGEEVQPKDGEKVKVTFDYSRNEDLVNADRNENQEVKVYHIEDKDEEGNKVEEGEENVVDVTNKQESAEIGIAVIDADSFSIYVVTYGNEDSEFSATLVGEDSARNNFHYKTISISDGENIYTLMDRNLGARVAWNTGTYAFNDKSNYNTEDDYYGYYYQWGNNYGFSNIQKYGNVISDAIPSNYVSSSWSTSNLGGYNLRGDTTNTESARQGPCPRGWHVPSANEWEAIKKAWCMSYNSTENCQGAGRQFAEALQMPTAGYRYYNYGKFIYSSSGSNGYYWSSTSNDNSKANYLFFRSSNVNINTDDRVNGLQVRCLKNNTDAVTLYLNPNGGRVENAIIDADAQGKVILPTATRNEYVFKGWFTSAGESEKIGDAGDEITINEDTDLYAHWAEIIPNPIVKFNNGADVTEIEVENGGTLTSEQIQQVSNLTHTKATFDGWYTDPEFNQTFDLNTPITADTSLYAKWTCNGGYIQLQGNGGPDMNCFEYGTMSYEDNDGNEHIIMDRNLGATMTGYGVNAEMGSYGYYYQWGNNYGFGPLSSVITSNTQVDCTNINPSTYSSSTFVIGSNDFDWCSSKNDNLWGGSEDGSGNNRGLDTISTTAADRQGPCPDGWHVPSIGERETLLIYGASLNSGTRKTGIRFYNYEMSFSNFIKFTNDFKLPIAGQRAHEGAQLINYGGGGSVNLWSSSPDVDYVWARHFNMNIPTFEASTNARNLRAYGFPVRCFMNELKNTLTLNAGGGTVDLGDGAQSIATTGIVKGESFTVPTATRTDHSFDGWFVDANENGKYDDGEVMMGDAGGYIIDSMDDNLTLTAKWKVTITYDGNGGTSDKELDFGQPGDEITLSGATQQGKVFGGWNNGTGYVGTQGDKYTLTRTETLLAQYYDYVVTFVYGNGERSADPIFLNNGDDDITLPSVSSVSGYIFDGWYDAPKGGNKIGDVGDSLSVNESRTLYAQGHYNSVELTDDNTTTTVGSGDVVDEVIGFPITMTVIENDILESPEGEELSELEGKELAGDITIDFGGVDAKFSHLVKVKIPVKGSSKAYVKVKHVSSESYNYDGLTRNIEASCNDGNIENSDDMYTGAYIDVEDGYVSIYTCEASNFAAFGLPKVTFEPNNGDDPIIVEVESGAMVSSEDIPTVTKSGYNFSGWYLTGAESAFDFSGTAITGDITLYAKWEQEGGGVTYTVTFDANRGTFADTPASQNVLGGGHATDPATLSGYNEPKLPGYDFDGWWTEPRGGTQWNFANETVTGNITLYAHWTYKEIFGDLDVYMIDSNGSLIKYVMMDRNLGATGVYNKNFDSQNPNSFGFVYQWGNNYGFPRCNGNATCNYSPITDTPVSVDIVENYIPSKFASSTWIGKNGGNSSRKSWHSNSGNVLKYLWGNGNTIDMQGPCPDGYHVPLTSETNDEGGLFRVWGDIYNKTINTIAGKGEGISFISDDQKLFTFQFLFPHAGNHKKGNTKEEEQNMCGDYWTATPSGLENAINMWFCKDGDNNFYDASGNFLFTNNSQRNNGSTLRCFKNSTDSANLDIVNGGKKGLITVEKVGGVATINAIKVPENTDASGTDLIFDGWYTSPTFESNTMKTGGDTLSDSVTALYAKWNCPDGSPYNSNNQCISGVLVRFMDEETEYTRSVVLSGEEVRAPATNPEKAGYIFTGWFESGANSPFVFTETPITGDLDLYAHWDINKYDVNVSVVTGDEDKGYLSGMGSTGISLTGLYNYGTELVFIAVPKFGYVFDYWMNGDQVLSGTDLGDGKNQLTIVVDQVLNIIAFFKSVDDTPTPYTVEHYQQNLAQTGYDFVWSGTMYGMANEQTNATGTNYTGFILSGNLADYQTGIKADGSTVVRLYYNRDVYTVNITVNDNSFGSVDSSTVVVNPGATISIDNENHTVTISGTTVTAEAESGYYFSGWQTDCQNPINSSCNIVAIFSASVVSYGDLDIYFVEDDNTSSHYTIEDRNLGATVVGTGSASFGYHYQWGNNHGFVSCGTNGCTKFLSGDTSDSTKVDTNGYGPENYYDRNVFVKQSDWSSGKNDNLWGNTTNTSGARQGPCPAGYHVPSYNEWNSLQTDWLGINCENYSSLSLNAATGCAKKILNDLLMPTAGRRKNNGELGMLSAGVYWLSTPAGSNAYGIFYYPAEASSGANALKINSEDRGRGKSVRCAKNDYNTPLTININGGSKASVSVYDGKLHYLTNPTKTGYEFSGWYSNLTGNIKIEDGSTLPQGTTTLYAKWICPVGQVEYNGTCVSGYTVSFYDEGNTPGVDSPLEQVTVLSGDAAVYPSENPTKEGYIFAGWVDEYGEPANLTSVTQDMDVFASYDTGAGDYTVSIASNNTGYGTVSTGSVTKPHGTPITDNGNGTLTIDDVTVTVTTGTAPAGYTYTFSGWTFSSECESGGNYAVAEGCAITGNFEATLNTYTVTFDLSGGSLTGDMTATKDYTIETPAISLSGYIPVRNGYTFTGWYRDGTLVDSIAGGETGDYMLVARWEAQERPVPVVVFMKMLVPGEYTDYDSNLEWGWGTVGELYTAPIEQFTHTGFYYEEDNESNVRSVIVSPDVDNEVHLYFSRIPYPLIITNAGEGISSTTTGGGDHLYEEPVTISVTPYTGWDFVSWSLSQGTLSGVNDLTQRTLSFNMPAEQVRISPNLYHIPYTVTFDVGSGTAVENQTYYYDEILSGLDNAITTRAGYEFSGWYLSGVLYTSGSTMPAEDITLTAVWDINEYEVDASVATGGEGYLSGMGSTGISLTGLYDYATELVFIAIPELGYVFDYWKNGDTVLSGTDLGDGTNQLTVVVDQILDIIAFFKPADDTPYTVEHYQANVGLTGYDFVWSGTMYGTTNTQTNATGTDYEGFSLHNGDISEYQTGIKADGSTVVRLYYDRNRYIVTWNTWNGHEVTKTDVAYGQHPYYYLTPPERDVLDPEDEDYDFTFTGWTRSGVSGIVDLETEIVTGDITYTAEYDRSFKYYTVKYYPGEGTGIMSDQTNLQLHTSGNLTKNTFTRTGYIFSGWYSSMGLRYEDEQEINMGRADGFEYDLSGNFFLSLEAQWKPRTDTKVTVNYYLKNLDVENNILTGGSREYLTGVEFTGVADNIVDILERYGTGIEGYEYSKSIVYGPDFPGGVETGTTTILADGSRVIDMYYVPRKYNFTLNTVQYSSTAGSSESTGYYYGAKVTLGGDSSDDCFMWSGWTTTGITLSDNTLQQTWFTMPANNVTVASSVREKTYDVTFNGGDGVQGSMESLSGVVCTENITLNNNFSKTGYTFTGWSTISGGTRSYTSGQVVSGLSKNDGENVNLYAIWDINQFDINVRVATGDEGKGYLSGMGSVGVSLTGLYDFGETLVVIAVPELGYLFDYWEVNESTELPEGVTASGNQLTVVVDQILDVVAHFKENVGTVTVNYYEMNTGGTYPGVANTATFTGLVGYTGYATLQPPVGFYLDTTSTVNTGIVISENNAENVINIYYARNKHNITLGYAVAFLNPGSVTVIPTPRESGYYYGEDVHFEAIVSTGYVFKQWRVNGVPVAGGADGVDFVMGDEDVNLVVDGDLITYNIDYYTDPGSTDPYHENPHSYTVLSGEITINEPIAEFCHNFLGWTGGTTGDWILTPTTGLVIDSSKGGDRKYYANWERKSYDVELSVDPSSGGTVTGAGTYRCMGEIELHATSNTGYHFVGWYDTGGNLVSSNSMYFFRAPVGSLGTGLIAKFERNQYYVTIDKNGSGHFWGESAPSGRYYHGTPITFIASPSNGYKIQKWTRNRQNIMTGANNELYTGYILDVTVTETGNYEVYFEPETYNIIYMDSGSILTGLSPTTYTVENHVYSGDLPSITKDGYIFAGWFYEYPRQPQYQIQEIGYVPVDGQSVTILAGWMPIDYNIRYHLLTGVETIPWEEYYPYESYQSYNIETVRTNLPRVEKDGYIFSGWVDNYGKSLTGFGGGMTGDLDLYPTWKSDVMDITVNYYEMDTNGDYSYIYETYNYTGLTDSTFYVPDYSKTGFTLHYYVLNGTTYYDTTPSLVVSGNTSANVIDVYYQRAWNSLQIYTNNGSNYSLSPYCQSFDGYNYSCSYYYGTEITINNYIWNYDEGYSFSGWNIDSEYSLPDDAYLSDEGISFLMPDHPVYIGLETNHILYRLTFTGYEGADVMNADSMYVSLTGENYYRFDSEIELPYLDKPGYNFMGWNSGDYNEWSSYYSSDPYHPIRHMPSHDVELTAEFSPRTDMEYYKYYYFQDTEGTGYSLSGYDRYEDGTTDQRVSSNCTYVEGFTHSRGEPDILYIKATGDNYINCYYDRDEYMVDVIYDDSKLSISGTGYYRYEAPVNLTATVKTGYEFSGFSSEWPEYNTTDSTLSFNVPLGGSYPIYAYAKPIVYSIEYEMYGGWLTPYQWYITGYTVDGDYDLGIFDAVKDGYTFLGWTGGEIGVREVTEPTKGLVIPLGSIGNRKYFANFQPNEENVVVNYYLKKIDVENNTLTGGVDIYLTGVVFTGLMDDVINISGAYLKEIEGYHYDHATVYSGEDEITAIETTILANGSREINMYYIPNKYNFTLNSDSYSSTEGSSESTGYYYGATVRLSGDSNNDCYIWSGWITNGITLSDNTLNQTGFTMPANNVIVTPSVREMTYNIVFSGNGSTSGEMSSMMGVRCTESTGLILNSFQKIGYRFTGWSIIPGSNTGEYTDGQSVSGLSKNDGVDVNLYAVWDIDWYTVTFDLNGGSLTGDMTETKDYTIETPEISLEDYIPVKTGYNFSGWYKGNDLTNSIAGGETWNYTLTAKWEADSDTEFKVEYYLQNVEDDGYTFAETGLQTGTTNTTGYADITKEFTGFIFSGGNQNNITSGVVVGDGSLVLKLYYDRKEYNVTTGEVEHGIMEGGAGSQRYGKRITFTAHPDAGYVISKWLRDGTKIISGGVIWTGEELEIEVDTGMEIGVEFKAKEDTPYYVEYYKEKLEGGYNVWTGTYSGTTDQEAIASELIFTGFTYDSGNVDNVTTGNIDGDGSRVLVMYYTRNINNVVYVYTGKVPTGQVVPVASGYKYESNVTVAEAPSVSGYNFSWSTGVSSFIMPDEEVTITGTWIANTGTKYAVKHMLQNVEDDEYTQTGENQILSGETDELTDAQANNYTGFVAQAVTQTGIRGDESTVVEIYYDREIYEVTTGETEHGSVSGETGSQRYGKVITFTAHPEIGYVVSRWLRDGEEILRGGEIWTGEEIEIEVDTGMEISVEFKAREDTPYYVEYYKENLDGGYDVWTGIQYGTSDTEGVAQELSFTGFTYDSGNVNNVITGNIDGDGSKVLKMYYNREIYTITWLNEDGTDMDTTTVKYGEVPTHADPTQPADAHYTYKFKGWNPEPTFATGEISYRATYEHIVNKHTITWKNDDGSVIDKTMVEYGTIPTHTKPTKAETEDYRYVFAGWDPEVVAVVGDAEYTAVFNAEEKEKSSKGGGMSGGLGRGGNIDSDDNQHGSAEERSDLFTGDNETNSGNINDEPLSLYEWVHENDITTMDTLEYADPDGLLTRGHLAKMVVNYMVNVLGRKIPYDVTYNCRYWGDDESSRESDEIRDYATKACAFGVMGINMEDNKFLPNSIVTRAEFGTVMSRVLRGDKYDITDTDNRSYYENHLQALKKDNILTQIANPETRWEIRKWVWLVFRRIVEKYKK